MKKVCATLAMAGLLAVTTQAAAGGPGVEVTEESDGYGYSFPDDPLAAGVDVPGGTVLEIRNRIVRQTLITPRTEFVTEMLKSVEQI